MEVTLHTGSTIAIFDKDINASGHDVDMATSTSPRPEPYSEKGNLHDEAEPYYIHIFSVSMG